MIITPPVNTHKSGIMNSAVNAPPAISYEICLIVWVILISGDRCVVISNAIPYITTAEYMRTMCNERCGITSTIIGGLTAGGGVGVSLPWCLKKMQQKCPSWCPFRGQKVFKCPLRGLSSRQNAIKCPVRWPPSEQNAIKCPLSQNEMKCCLWRPFSRKKCNKVPSRVPFQWKICNKLSSKITFLRAKCDKVPLEALMIYNK